MSAWYRAPEIRFLQDQGRLNVWPDSWSDSESDDASFTKDSEEEEHERKKTHGRMNEKPQKMWIRPYQEKDREAVAEVVSVSHPNLP